MTGIALWTGGLALTPFLRPGGSSTVPSRWKRGRLQVVYVGANDCAPCLRWRREKRPAFEETTVFRQIDYREVIATSLMTALEDQFWPEGMRNLRDVVAKDGGAVPYWMLVRDGHVIASAGGESAWDRRIWPLIVLES